MKNTLNDEEVAILFKSTRDNKYFTLLYERYKGRVFRKCYSFSGDRELSNDYMQDIFIKIFTKVDSFKGDSKFSTWLFSITHNHCIDHFKKKRIIFDRLEDGFDSLEEVDLQPDYDFEQVTKILDKLPKDELNLLKEKYEHGMSIKQMADKHNLGESAVKMRLNRTKNNLKKVYQYD